MYAHQSADSFNAKVKEFTADCLSNQEFEVEVSDLYAMKFKATATPEDITGRRA